MNPPKPIENSEMEIYSPTRGVFESDYCPYGCVIRSATREEIERSKGEACARRYGIVQGWIDPTEYDMVIAACDDDPLVSRFAVAPVLRDFGRHVWSRPDLVEPLLEHCRDEPLKRALLLALYRVNAGKNRGASEPEKSV